LADSQPSSSIPRAVVGVLALVHGLIFGVAGWVLPWPMLSAFAVLAWVVTTAWLLLAIAAAVAPKRLPLAFRAASIVSLSFLAWATWELGSAAAYLVRLYAGVGAGLAGAAGAAWCVIALFSLPLGVWGIVATGGVLRGWEGTRRKRARAVIAVVAVAIAVVFVLRARSARGAERVDVRSAPTSVATALGVDVTAEPKRGKRNVGSLFLTRPVTCAKSPGDVAVTLLVVARAPKADEAKALCVQDATLDGAAKSLSSELEKIGDVATMTAAIDVVTEIAPIADRGVLMGAVAVRPGADGVCFAERCLPPWQAVALQQFTTMASFPSIQLDVGATATALKKALNAPVNESYQGLSRFASVELLLDRGVILELEQARLKEPPPVDREHVTRATRDALAFIIGAQDADGRFRYLVDPHTGTTSYANFSVPRQAGTTLAVCEMGDLDGKSKNVAIKSLDMLAPLQREAGDGRVGIAYPKGSARPLQLGNTALSMIAFLACRDRVGDKHDALIHGMGKLLLALQRDDGGFGPAWDLAKGARVQGADPMYAAGQAVLALVLWEAVLDGSEERPAGAPHAATLRAAIDRAMAHFAGPYWSFAVRDFFYLEENWHCLAARAALATHRNDAYERFCLDYVTMKSRFIFTDMPAGKQTLVGAYGFGTVFPPHNTATAGFAEAMSAAIAVGAARETDMAKEQALLAKVLGFLMRQQWNEATCFACTDKLKIPGGFSEHFGEPMMRIDYAQHAMAGIGHGGSALGLLPNVRAAGVPREK
jgi:hypothetical protein